MKVLSLTAGTILVLSAVLIVLATSGPVAQTLAATGAGTPLGPVDTYFVTQTSLGTPFQVDAGRVALAKGTTQAHPELCGFDGEFAHHREQRAVSDSEE